MASIRGKAAAAATVTVIRIGTSTVYGRERSTCLARMAPAPNAVSSTSASTSSVRFPSGRNSTALAKMTEGSTAFASNQTGDGAAQGIARCGVGIRGRSGKSVRGGLGDGKQGRGRASMSPKSVTRRANALSTRLESVDGQASELPFGSFADRTV